MSDTPGQIKPKDRRPWVRVVEAIGEGTLRRLNDAVGFFEFIGGAVLLVGETASWVVRSLFLREVRFGREHLFAQMVRVGVRSIPIVSLVQIFIGIILALQMAPTLRDYGQVQRVADIVAIAVFRELGPLLSGIVLSGFAGASIAAEIGAMVEGE